MFFPEGVTKRWEVETLRSHNARRFGVVSSSGRGGYLYLRRSVLVAVNGSKSAGGRNTRGDFLRGLLVFVVLFLLPEFKHV